MFIEAFLLPGASSLSDLHLDVEEGTIKFMSQWLLSQLLIYLLKYINYCIIETFHGMKYLPSPAIFVL